MKSKNKNSKTCPEALSNQCVIWQGGDVPSLGICNGDELSEAEKIIADKVVELMEGIDMSQIDISCILERCGQVCEDKSLQKIIQLLFDNQCCLRDLIGAGNGDAGSVEIVVNLRCLKKFDDFGNEVIQDLNAALQSIVNQVCTSKDNITQLQSTVQDLQVQIDNLSNEPDVPVEPNITTCITAGLKPVSQVVPIFAQDYCDYKGVVGTPGDVSKALSLQCEELNEDFQTTSGWNLTVSSMAQSLANAWITICDLRTRLTLIEENCCKVTCEDITIGFDVIYNETGDAINLRFTSKAGTEIPAGFTDCGTSYVTITDKNGVSVKYELEISNNADEGEFFITGLDLSDFLVIEVTANLCTEGLTCQKCATKLFNPNNATCPYCEIKVEGDPGSSVVIIYEEL